MHLVGKHTADIIALIALVALVALISGVALVSFVALVALISFVALVALVSVVGVPWSNVELDDFITVLIDTCICVTGGLDLHMWH